MSEIEIMDWHSAFDAIFKLALVMVGFVLNALWQAVQGLRADMRALEKAIPEIYARKDNIDDRLELIVKMLEDVVKRLEGKVDKTSK